MIKSKKKYLWLGNIYKNLDNNYNPAISYAANNWQKRILEKYFFDKDLKIISFMQERIWPFGKLIPQIDNKFQNQYSIKYLNLPFIKNFSIFIFLFIKLFQLHKKNKFDIIICYNPYSFYISTYKFFFRNQSSKFVIWADTLDVGKNFINYRKLINYVDGHIFLSKYLHDVYQGKNKIFFEGLLDYSLITNHKQKRKSKKYIIFYCGSLSKWTGIEKFITLFRKLDSNLFEFRFSSPDSINVNLEQSLNKNIKFLGFLDNKKLNYELSNSDILLNNRDYTIDGNQNNFPSKILNYLSYKKPILSVKVKSLDSKYDEILYYFDLENSKELEKKLFKIIKMDKKDKIAYDKKINLFLSKFNSNNLKKLDEFINS